MASERLDMGFFDYDDSYCFRYEKEFYKIPCSAVKREEMTLELAKKFVEDGTAKIYKVPHL